jgi:choline kinase
MKTIILAAGTGRRLKAFTRLPKCLIKIKNEPLIKRYISLLQGVKNNDIVLVVGYRANEVMKTLKKYRLRVKVIKNDGFREGSILSLWAAREQLRGEVLLMDSDMYFEKRFIQTVAGSKKSSFFLIDGKARRDNEAVMVGFKNNRAVALGRGLKGNYPVTGEWAGILKLSPFASRRLKKILEKKISSGERETGYEFIIPDLFRDIPVSFELIDGLKWTEIDTIQDVHRARRLIID